MRQKQILIAVVVLSLMGLSSGCLWAPGLDRVKKDLERQLPEASFDRRFAISLGPLSIGLARTIVRFVPDAREASEYLHEVSSIKVAIYEVSNIPPRPKLRMPQQLVDLVENVGWEIAARVNQPNETMWLLYRSTGDVVEDIYLVVLSDDELVVVTARGRIDRLLVKAMREHGLAAHDSVLSL